MVCPNCAFEANPKARLCGQCGLYLQAVGEYRICAPIGKGGFASVYRAEHNTTSYPAAIKVLHDTLAQDEDFHQRFLREAEFMRRISDPHVIQLYDFGAQEGLGHYLVMEWLEGQTLDAFVKQQPDGRLPEGEAIDLCKQLLGGLQSIHAQEIIHRDLKPQNIYIQPDGTLKILDFGIAWHADDDSLTQTHMFVGSTRFMSPEQFNKQKDLFGPHTDLYATGMILVWMLTGSYAFEGQTFEELAIQHIMHHPPPLKFLCPEVTFSTEIEAIVSYSLRKNPQQRFQRAQDFIDALDDPAAFHHALSEEFRSSLHQSLHMPYKPSQPPRSEQPQALPSGSFAASHVGTKHPSHGSHSPSHGSRSPSHDATVPEFDYARAAQEAQAAAQQQTPPAARPNPIVRVLSILGAVVLIVAITAFVVIRITNKPTPRPQSRDDRRSNPPAGLYGMPHHPRAISQKTSKRQVPTQQHPQKHVRTEPVDRSHTLPVRKRPRLAKRPQKKLKRSIRRARTRKKLAKRRFRPFPYDHPTVRLWERIARGRTTLKSNNPAKSLRQLPRVPLSVRERVHYLNISDNPISDRAFSYLRYLPRLRSLQSRGIRLKGPGLRVLRQLPHLAKLRLARCNLSARQLRHLGKLPRVFKLELSQNPITKRALKYLQRDRLPRLWQLDLSVTPLDNSSLPHLLRTNANSFQIYKTKIDERGIHAVCCSPAGRNRKRVRFQRNFPSDGSNVKYCKNIVQKGCNNPPRTSPQPLPNTGQGPSGGLSNVAINFWRRSRIVLHVYSAPKRLRQLPQVPLAIRERVSFLNLSRVKLSNQMLAQLRYLPNLRTLYASRLRGPKTLRLDVLAGLRYLRVLYMRKSGLRGPQLRQLARIRGLRVLYLDSNPITDRDLRHLRGIRRLRELSLNNTKISNAGIPYILKTSAHLLSVINARVDIRGARKFCCSPNHLNSPMSSVTMRFPRHFGLLKCTKIRREYTCNNSAP